MRGATASPTLSCDLKRIYEATTKNQALTELERFSNHGGNLLFLGADSGGERAAATCSHIGTARMNGIDPEAYLRYVFTHIADYPINKVADLLPWNVVDRLV